MSIMIPRAENVLHLEDSDLDAELVRERLEALGLSAALERVSNRRDFVEALGRKTYDLILSDYQVPGFEGLDALQMARGTQPETPFIFVSGAMGEEIAVESLKLGATDYVLKQRLGRLKFVVERALAESHEKKQRKAAEQALHEQQRLFARIASATPDLIYLYDVIDGRSIFCNEQVAAVLGLTPEQVGEICGGAHSGVLVHPDDRKQFAQDQRRFDSFADGELLDRTYRMRHADGSWRWLHCREVVFERTSDGRAKIILGVAQDVTKHREADEALRQRTAILQAVSNNTTELIFVKDRESRFIYANPATLKVLGLTEQEALGGDGLQQTVQPASEIAAIYANDRKVLHSGEEQTFEEVLTGPNGTRVYLSTKTPFRNEDGKVIGIIGISRDITERRQAEEKLRQQEEKLREADRRKDEFLATLAHELRNPLAPIRNGLALLKIADRDAIAIEQVRSMMERQLTQMIRLVDDLLDVSRITRDKLVLRKERVALSAVIHSALETSRPLVEANGHELSVTMPSEPIYLDADTTRLSQVFANLLNNAAKYTERSGHIALNVSAPKAVSNGKSQPGKPDEVVVTIKDSGVGIPTAMLPQVFDLFIQVDRTLEKAQGGLGIGLTLVRRLVEMHGGNVEARSEGPGKGSEFIVRLPIAARAPSIPVDDEQAAGPPMSRRRILVVDDNEDSGNSLCMLLDMMGNDVRVVHSGASALESIGDFRPDIVLLDIGMPEMNGYEVCRTIRMQPLAKQPVIVACTGWGQPEDRRRSHEAGFNHHLVKPVDIDALKMLLVRSVEIA
jgi:PAS domain S-box-containing protein